MPGKRLPKGDVVGRDSALFRSNIAILRAPRRHPPQQRRIHLNMGVEFKRRRIHAQARIAIFVVSGNH